MSPGGRQIAVHQRPHIVVLDALTGEVLARILNRQCDQLAFSPDGKKLAAVYMGGGASFYDVATCELIGELNDQWKGGGQPTWTDPDHLLIGSTLYCASKLLPLWTYPTTQVPGPMDPKVSGGLTWFAVEGGNSGRHLVGVTMPPQEALQFERNVPDEAFVLKPGAKISLEVNLGVDNDKVTQSLTKLAQNSGFSIETGQQIRLKADRSMPADPANTQNPGVGGKAGRAGAATPIYTLQIVGEDNLPLWQTSTAATAPSYINFGKGETEEAAQRRVMRDWAQPKWYASIKLPSRLLSKAYLGGGGNSQITANGFERLK